MTATRDALAAAIRQPRPVKAIEVPDLGTVYIRSLSGTDREAIERRAGQPNFISYRALMAAACLSDEQGQALFTTEQADLDQLNKLDWRVLQLIFNAAAEHNGMKPDSHEDAVKN